MAKFDVNYESTLSPELTFEKLKSFISSAEGIKKLDDSAKIEVQEKEKKITAKSKQFSAGIAIQPSGTGSKVSISVDISFLLLPFKGKIQATLQKMLEKNLVG